MDLVSALLLAAVVVTLVWLVWYASYQSKARQHRAPTQRADARPRLSGSSETTKATTPAPPPPPLQPVGSTQGRPVIIIGGGITGLIVAYELTNSRIPFVLLEAKSHVGGRVMTLKYADGTTSEEPLEEYWERSPIVALLRELKLPVIKSGAHSSILLDGKIMVGRGDPQLRDYLSSLFDPSEQQAFLQWNDKVWQLYQDLHRSFWAHYENLHELASSPSPLPAPVFHTSSPEQSTARKAKKMTPLGHLHLGHHHFTELNAAELAALAPPSKLPLPEHLRALMSQSFADFVRASRLPHKVSEWIRLTLEPEIATEWSEISAADGIDEFRLFLNTPDGFGEANYHVQGGNMKFIKALAAALPRDSIRTRCTVSQINQSNGPSGGAQVVYIDEDDGGHVGYARNSAEPQSGQVRLLEGSYLVCTVPVHELHHIRFHPPLDAPRLAAIHSTRMGSYAKLHVRLRPSAAALWAKHGEDVFTLLTDHVCGAVYNSTHATSSADKRDLTLTVLLHGKTAKHLIALDDDGDIEAHVRSNLETLFPVSARTSPTLKSSPSLMLSRTGPWHWVVRGLMRWPIIFAVRLVISFSPGTRSWAHTQKARRGQPSRSPSS